MNILDHTHDQFVKAFRHRYDKGAHYSTAIYRQVMKTGTLALDRLDEFVRLPQLVRRLEADIVLPQSRLIRQVVDGGVVKFVTRLADNLDIESVVIPMFKRNTLCVSSQVGCRMGCRFCRTGKMGLIRSLTVSEIVGQVFAARHQQKADIRNVVFMGMGEPLDNLDNVMQAIRVMEDQRGLDIARRYITVSTVGLVAGIDRLARLKDGPVNLAISLNAPSDDIRSLIMPVTRSNTMAELQASLMRYPLARKGSLFVEYVLIDGINDRPEHARVLAQYLSPLKVKMNLIAFNPSSESDLQAPSVETYERFHARLVQEKVFVRRRGEKGAGIMAACGQLGGRQVWQGRAKSM